MTSITFFLIFIPILSFILLAFNFLLAPHNPYKEKKTPFECGYHSFLSQNRTQFTISFFIFALLFLIFDLEIVLIYPYSVSSYANNIYGLIVMIIFTLIVTVGFIFELGKNALKIESKQSKSLESSLFTNNTPKNKGQNTPLAMVGSIVITVKGKQDDASVLTNDSRALSVVNTIQYTKIYKNLVYIRNFFSNIGTGESFFFKPAKTVNIKKNVKYNKLGFFSWFIKGLTVHYKSLDNIKPFNMCLVRKN